MSENQSDNRSGVRVNQQSVLDAKEREKKRYDLIQTAVATLTSLGSAALVAIYAAASRFPNSGSRLRSYGAFMATIFYLVVVILGVMIFHRLHNIVALKSSLDDRRLEKYRVIQFWTFVIATCIVVLFLSVPLFFGDTAIAPQVLR